jgi:hypothetical protein
MIVIMCRIWEYVFGVCITLFFGSIAASFYTGFMHNVTATFGLLLGAGISIVIAYCAAYRIGEEIHIDNTHIAALPRDTERG